jgi:hypothetical protein
MLGVGRPAAAQWDPGKGGLQLLTGGAGTTSDITSWRLLT